MRKRDISHGLPYSEFPAATGTFTGLAISVLLGLFGAVDTYASSINITIPSGSTVLNTLNDGTFSESSVNASALVWTDNYTGYNLTILGGNSTGALEGTKGGTIPSIETEVTPTRFASDATLMNKWGFKPSKLYKSGTTIDNSNYIKSPTSDESVIIDNTKVANDENHKNTYTLALAAKVDNTTPLDSYSQTFTLAATGNATEYHIAYADPTTIIPAQQSGTISGESIKLSSEYPSKYGYTFLGWCTVVPVGSTCPGDTYYPGGVYGLDDTTDNSVTLYAMWRANYGTFDSAFASAGVAKVNGYYPMQGMSETICNNVTIGTTGTLIDTRDNRTYEVIKYADNNCWMHQNLELTLYAQGDNYATNKSTPAVKAGNITVFNNSNTDITNNATYNVSSFYATQSKAATTSGDPNFAWADDGTDGSHSFSWPAYNPAEAYAIPTGSQNTYGQDEYETNANGAPSQRGGNSYNWTMATLGSGVGLTNAEAPNSICPKGWQLPVNSGNKSFYNLLDAYYTGTISSGNPQTNSTIANPSALTIQQNLMRSDPLDFVVSGVYHSSYGTIDSRTTEGTFWSGTASSAAQARVLASHSTAFYSQGTPYRGNGLAVRCVAR